MPPASDAAGRMAGLESFLEYWLGPRQRVYGEPPELLKDTPLPMPLRRLYEFAGRWRSANPDLNEKPNVFHAHDLLRTPAKLQLTDDGKLIFVDGAEGQCTWATLTEGEDPPVWRENDRHALRAERWTEVDESLSGFLQGFCLGQLLRGAALWREDAGLEKDFALSQDESCLLWEKETDPTTKAGTRFFLWRDTILVGETEGPRLFAAKEGTRLSVARSVPHEVIGIGIDTGNSWSLEIQSDGSGRVWLRGGDKAEASFPEGSFEFAETRDGLMAATGTETHEDAAVYFHRAGQSFCPGQAVEDEDYVRRVFDRARALARVRAEDFDRLYFDDPPFPRPE